VEITGKNVKKKREKEKRKKQPCPKLVMQNKIQATRQPHNRSNNPNGLAGGGTKIKIGEPLPEQPSGAETK